METDPVLSPRDQNAQQPADQGRQGKEDAVGQDVGRALDQQEDQNQRDGAGNDAQDRYKLHILLSLEKPVCLQAVSQKGHEKHDHTQAQFPVGKVEQDIAP